jgi:hypothetical protein
LFLFPKHHPRFVIIQNHILDFYKLKTLLWNSRKQFPLLTAFQEIREILWVSEKENFLNLNVWVEDSTFT